ncbi:hypothetical protein [Frigoriglobus tundricola]|uniref:Uncharacterized protein n=1 Tax=Frigoriglobus tundricola TaxID=2774151 RepID=A0A6M5YFS3_9BACT|nr:hypothetical protein [Frigoriglobus tundricola]QJW92879.1 hypothetical protein FTUN_0376 [Frigoriglobus tundricola]
MSQDASRDAANHTAPAAPPASATSHVPPVAAPPSSGGLKSTLRVVVPLLALGAVVFGVTFFAQYTPPTETTDPKDPRGGPEKSSGEPPLRFFTSARRWDPPKLTEPGYRHMPLLAPSAVASTDADSRQQNTFSIQDRIFQGYYEPGDTQRATQFWFENRNPSPVALQLRRVSCNACSGARVAAIPPETTKSIFQHAALAALPIGAFHGYGVGLVEPAAALTKLEWTQAQFRDDPNAKFHVPAASNPDKWAPQWGILELTFRVGENPKLPLTADFATQVEGTTRIGGQGFALMYEPAPACEVSRASIDAGIIDALSGEREYELIVYSNTRGPGSEFGDLDKPSFLIDSTTGITDPVKFVEVTNVQRIPDAELPALAERLYSEHKRTNKVRAAYRVTVTFRPRVGENRLEIGQMERVMSVSCNSEPQKVTIKATVHGAVRLENNRTEIELKTFNGRNGHEEWVDLIAEKTGGELVVVKDECKPADFGFELVKQPDRGGQGYYRLKISIDKGKVYGQVKGVVVLEVKGPNPQRIRIPFKGLSQF